MATVIDYYEIQITMENAVLQTTLGEFSFTLQDSIFEPFNTGILKIEDENGLFQESLILMPGSPIDIEFGIKGQTTMKSPFSIVGYTNNDIINPGTLGGSLEISLVNRWYSEQAISAEGYYDRISDIVRAKVSNVGFNAIHINDTSNLESWFQGLMGDAQFINNMAYYAFSLNSEATPFYVFVDSNNEFNFRNYYSLYASNEVTTLTYVPEEEHNSDIDIIRDIRPYTKGYAAIQKGLRRLLFSYDDNRSEEHTSELQSR